MVSAYQRTVSYTHLEQLVSFVDGFVTDEADLTDAMYEEAERHNEKGAWQMIFGAVSYTHLQHWRNRHYILKSHSCVFRKSKKI